jgi:hypothetical protein
MTSSHEFRDPEAEERERDIHRDAHIASRAANQGAIDPESDGSACRASEYASLNDTYNGRALCGCLDCIEYVADRESEDGV